MGQFVSSCSKAISFHIPMFKFPNNCVDELQNALRKAGLESSNLIVAIDYTKSNEWTGKRTFHGKCLHDIDPTGFRLNPYQSVIRIIGQTLEVFDEENHLVPAFGFGDANTKGTSCFRFLPSIAEGFVNVLRSYKQITPNVQLSGPTNFAPVIKETIRIVNHTRQYYVLLIIADSQVTCEKDTANAIVEASYYPLFGVGDGPWDAMEEYNDKLPRRLFDNFQFIEYNKVLEFNRQNPDVGFATAALMEIPEQYKSILELGILHEDFISTRRSKADAMKFASYNDLQNELLSQGLEKANMLIAIDYTKSNESIINTFDLALKVFVSDQPIRVFGFGDVNTRDTSYFEFPQTCQTFKQVLECYTTTTPSIKLAGPTSFTPVIEKAIEIVKEINQYHLLILLADGQITCEMETLNTIVKASNYPLSILMIGIGDGPWDMMNTYTDNLPKRHFDNFHFVPLNQTLQFNYDHPEIGFATAALSVIPRQYKTIKDGTTAIPTESHQFQAVPTESHKFQAIPDSYETFEELQKALRRSGLESSNLVLAIDYTKSNTWTGERSFQGKCLHYIDPRGAELNPYQKVILTLGRTLEAFDDDNLIPAFGFGDIHTGGNSCFNMGVNSQPCQGFAQVLTRYNQLTPTLKLSGPTNFAPVIRQTIDIVRQSQQYHILVIVADGQVSNEQDTADAIVQASNYPISIIMVGVGDGPWDMMNEFDDNLPQRRFDNFQFVEYAKVLQYNKINPDIGFATAALMEIPEQYKLIRKMGLLSTQAQF
ncbi:hypothetical protein THRCLA_21826 [Thraustotheca clavata]|uniref:VWFA domain-containing protein n=1 Tax=Thraustotheca clavata TaxID=74557 RepID=A0A1V9ZNG6_9STRA|nr:hypothetical protein THRCLA_21826 [Thraustotheca clavata]